MFGQERRIYRRFHGAVAQKSRSGDPASKESRPNPRRQHPSNTCSGCNNKYDGPRWLLHKCVIYSRLFVLLPEYQVVASLPWTDRTSHLVRTCCPRGRKMLTMPLGAHSSMRDVAQACKPSCQVVMIVISYPGMDDGTRGSRASLFMSKGRSFCTFKYRAGEATRATRMPLGFGGRGGGKEGIVEHERAMGFWRDGWRADGCGGQTVWVFSCFKQ